MFRSPLSVLLRLLLVAATLDKKITEAGFGLVPPEFSVTFTPSGPELVWTPKSGGATRGSKRKQSAVPTGGSRYEFRLESASGSTAIVGYPRESNGSLALPFTIKIHDQLRAVERGGGGVLQVWTSSGRRIDTGHSTSGPSSAGFVNATISNVTPTPTISVDPAAPGNYTIRRVSYDLRPRLRYPDFPFPIEVVAEVTYPEGPTLGGEKLPLVIFLHGRHATCYQGGLDTGDWPCPTGYRPIKSHVGYRYVGDVMASQGMVAVSIAANGINGQDWLTLDGGAAARSLLIRHHLLLWSQWNSKGGDPWGGSLHNRLDMSNVVLVGHSRGGEGVNRAAIDARATDPYNIVGLMSYAPTAFGVQVRPDITSAIILPTCDGDVSDLQGQFYVDASRDIARSVALRSAITVLGANHNYFNTEWTPGLTQAPSFDDWHRSEDPVCGISNSNVRLSPQEQQAVGAAYTLALVRFVLYQDAAMLPLLDGTYVRPAVIGRAEVSTQAVGGAGYRLLYRPEEAGGPALTLGMRGRLCRGYSYNNPSESGLPRCASLDTYSPHWLARTFEDTHPTPLAMELRWNVAQAGATASFAVSSATKDLSSLDWITVRVANDPGSAVGAKLELWVRDKQGRAAQLNTSLSSIDGWPGTGELDRVHARAFRGSLASAPGESLVDLKNVAAVLLVAQTLSGKVWVIDIAAVRDKGVRPPALSLPVVSVESLVVPEGDGARTAAVKITSDRPLSSAGSIWVHISSDCGAKEGYELSLPSGSTTLVGTVPVSWIGDKVFSQLVCALGKQLAIGTVKGVLTGSYLGGVVVEEDESPPTLSVARRTVRASEGVVLEWNLELSAPTGGLDILCFVVPPPVGKRELRSNDVPAAWLRSAIWTDLPANPTRLSLLSLIVRVRFDYGVRSASLVLPISTDGFSEGEEWVAFTCSDGGGVLGRNIKLYGRVSKNGRRARIHR